MPVKYWDGSQWVELSKSQVQAYDGSAFAEVANASYYDGSAFQSLFNTANTNVIDDFEDGDIAEYVGDTGNYQTVTSPVFNGTYSLQADTSGSAVAIYDYNNTNSPTQGDTFNCWVRTGSLGDENPVVYWAAQDTNMAYDGGYSVEIQRVNGVFRLKIDNSGLDSTPVTLSNGSWYRVNVDWQTDGSITATLYDDSGTQIAEVSATDTTYTSGGIGFVLNAPSSATAHFDNYHIP